MDVSSIGRNTSQTDQDPLLMEEHHHNHEHIVDITGNDYDSSSSRSSLDELTPHHQLQERASSSNATQLPPPPSQQRADGGRTSSTSTSRRSPLNSGLWISVELVVTVAQIVAAIVVMVLAKDEHPEAPLSTWVVGYTSGCVATLPILYWRFRTYNRGTRGQDSSQRGSTSSTQGNNNNPSESMPYTPVSADQVPPDEENTTNRNNQVGDSLRTR